jgi:hypothetical protein
VHIEHGRGDPMSLQHVFEAPRKGLVKHRYVGGRAAHVEADQLPDACPTTDLR